MAGRSQVRYALVGGLRVPSNLGLERLDQLGPFPVQLVTPEHHAAVHALADLVEDGFRRWRALLRRDVTHAEVWKPQSDGPAWAGYERMHACGGAVVRAHCRSISSILLLITGSICCCSAVICCRIASGIPSWTASVTGSIVWAGLLPQRLRFRAAAGASELPAASSVLAPHRLRRLPSVDSGAAAGSADSGAGGEASVMGSATTTRLLRERGGGNKRQRGSARP